MRAIRDALTRRRWLRRAAATSVAALGLADAASAAEPSLRVGTGRAEITPPLEVGILMSSSRRQWAPFEGVRKPLYARAIALESGRSRVAVVALDLLGLAGEAVGGWDEFKQRVSAASDGAAPPSALAITSTHTHSAPESLALTELFHTPPFQAWVARLAERIGLAVRDACQAPCPCRLVAGVLPAPPLSENRRVLTKRGIRNPRAVGGAADVVGPEGPIDDQLRVLRFEDAVGQPLAMLVNAAAHPVYEMCIKQVSPDYPGAASCELETRCPGVTALFLQGATGNINPLRVSTGAADADEHGRRIADVVRSAAAQFDPVAGVELALLWRDVPLAGREPTGEARTEPLVARIGALRIGQAAIVFLPGEPFVEIALAIRRSSPFAWTAVAGYSEDYIGYIPTDRAFPHGGYETGPGRWSRVASGSEAIVCRAAAETLARLAKSSD